jgi:hypothetical protein
MLKLIVLFFITVNSECDVASVCHFDYFKISYDSQFPSEYSNPTKYYRINYQVQIDNITFTLNDIFSGYIIDNYFNSIYTLNEQYSVHQCIICPILPTKISINLNISKPNYYLLVYILIPVGLIVGIIIAATIAVCLSRKSQYANIN